MRIFATLAMMAVALTTVTTVSITSGGDEPTVEALPFRSLEFAGTGPLGPITVFGDSVMLGSGITSPTIVDHLAARGWGPIRYLAGGGFNTGVPERAPAGARATTTIERWRAEGWDPTNVVINLGANDAWACTTVECNRAQIERVLDVVGPGKRVWWPQITLQPRARAVQDRWNTALGQLAAERPDFHTWNWPGEMAAAGYRSSDNIHLTGEGYTTRSARMAQLITARLGAGTGGGPPVALPTATSPPSRFVALGQQRLVDTRTDPAPQGGRRSTGDVVRVELAGSIPDGATAVALYLAAADTRRSGFLTAAPCGTTTDTSSVNFPAGGVRGGPAIVEVGTEEAVCVSVTGDAHVIVDLQGAFHPTDPRGLGLDPLDTPRRLHDTRQTGRSDVIRVTAPSGVTAVALNLTAVGAAGRGFLVAAPCGTDPGVASLNFEANQAIAAAAIVEVGDDGTFCVTSSTSTDVIVDLTGTFATDGALSFVPVTPTRMLDTRVGTGGWTTLHGGGQVVRVRVAPPEARAVTGTLTIVRPLLPAFLTASPCGRTPPTSSVNAAEATIAANASTTGVTEGDLCVLASVGTHTLFDTTGWWTP